MSLKRCIFNFVQKLYIAPLKILPGYIGKFFNAELAERLIVIDKVKTKYGILKYYCFGHISVWRSKTIFTKEPETIEWIDSMSENDVLWDIGANIGLYSVYAGIKGMNVFSFEPSSLNTFLLSKNIEINSLKDNVSLFPMAISDANEFGYLNMTSTQYGGALSEFSQNDTRFVGNAEYKKEVIFKQGMFSYSIDDLIDKYCFAIPNYIKIDVDSIEDKIIYGASKTLLDKRLKGILVELDEAEPRTKTLIDFLANHGLHVKYKKHSEIFNDSKFKNLYNYIFERS